jgi:PAS domain S-box-containing protein
MNTMLNTVRSVFHGPHRRRSKHALLQQLSRAVEQCPVSIVITDTKGTIEYVNPWFEKVSGYTAAEAIGANPRVLKSGRQPVEFYRSLWETITAGNDWTGELHNRRKNGELYWEKAVISPLRNERGTIVNYVAVKEDITARKQADEQVIAARDEAERANRAKSLFLANMSHELRTPLNVISGLAATLLEQELSAETRSLVQLISQSGGTLLGIIEEVLEFAKIQAGREHLDLHSIDLADVVKHSLDLVAEMTKDRPVTLSVGIAAGVPARIEADARRLQQILVNLLGNAVKFTEYGRVDLFVECRAAADGKDRLTFSITDTGPGISPETLAGLFQPFQQGDNSITRRFGGSGLGLAISRSFAQLMGGDIVARSVLHHGSVFTVELPIIAPAGDLIESLGWGANVAGRFMPWSEVSVRRTAPAAPCTQKTRSLGRRLPLRILAADDVATNRHVLQVIFKHLGYSPHVVEDGAQVLAALRVRPYDLILLDVQMPVMDGLTAAREIRAQYGTRDDRPRIVALTANASEESRRACLEAGMDDFLTKPVVPKQIEACFLRLFGHAVEGESEARLAEPATPPLPWVDESHLAAISDGMSPRQSSEMLLQLAVTFGADFTSTMAQIELACREHDAEALVELVHGLKGGAAMMGWSQFGGGCRVILEDLRAERFEDWVGLPERLRRMHLRSAMEFEQLLAKVGGAVAEVAAS